MQVCANTVAGWFCCSEACRWQIEAKVKKAVHAERYEDGKCIQCVEVQLIGIVFAFPARLPATLNDSVVP